MQQDLVDPIRRNLLYLPRRRFLNELVDLSVQLMHWVQKDRKTAGGALSHYPRNRRVNSDLFHCLEQLSGKDIGGPPFRVFRFLYSQVNT